MGAYQEPVQLMSSSTRIKRNNANIAQKDFNPILHNRGYFNPGDHNPVSGDYGKVPSRNKNFGPEMVVPNTTQGNN